MAIVTRTTAKSYFKTGDKPTQSQFGDFIDSSLFYEDTSDLGRQLVSASSATSARSLLGAGTVGNNLFIATTTASGQNQLGIDNINKPGVVGNNVLSASTTASAQQNIGGGTVGRQIFEAITTASATNLLQQATSSTIGVSYLQSNKNAIINGEYNVWQRNTSFTSVSNGDYTADRWQYIKNGSMVHDISRSTDTPTVTQAGRLYNYSLLIDCQTIDSSIAAGDYTALSQKIEGFNWLSLAQNIITLSFWVKATKTGIYCASLRNSGVDKSIVKEYTINTSDTWEYKTLTFAASPSTGTWNYTTGIGAWLTFALTAGSTYQGTADSWQSSNIFATSNQVNACDSTSNNFRLCGVQLEIGSIPTPFEQRTFQEEYYLCRRYYRKSYEYATILTTITNLGSRGGLSITSSNFYSFGYEKFDCEMRSTPTITIYNPVTGAANSIRDTVNNVDRTPTITNASTTGYNISSSSMSTSIPHSWHDVADAEL